MAVRPYGLFEIPTHPSAYLRRLLTIWPIGSLSMEFNRPSRLSWVAQTTVSRMI